MGYYSSMESLQDTPLESYPELAEKLGIPGLLFKREDMGRYGSHKGRSIPFMIDTYSNEGKTAFAISSSGNAARAAIEHIQKAHPQAKLTVFVGTHINNEKLDYLRNSISSDNIQLEQVERPLQSLTALTKDGTVQSLRQSTDKLALAGYQSLANELMDIETDGVFIPTSSGTTAEALLTFTNLPIHIVQTEKCHPIAKAFGTDAPSADTSIADALVDSIAHRKDSIATKLHENNGNAWVPNEDTIRKAMQLTEETTGIFLSPNSAVAIAGIMEATKNGFSPSRPIIALITGK